MTARCANARSAENSVGGALAGTGAGGAIVAMLSTAARQRSTLPATCAARDFTRASYLNSSVVARVLEAELARTAALLARADADVGAFFLLGAANGASTLNLARATSARLRGLPELRATSRLS